MSLARFEAGIFRIQIYSMEGALRLEELMCLCNENQLYALFILSLFRQSTSTYSDKFVAYHQEVRGWVQNLR
jgi:hypothetical protein